ncbi:hypothetical protein LTR28_009773 [Elasticomyces elasticus]|nr:hypothetical protein LTR28_009773 [Elasticomyces elasticus]
MPWVSTPPWDSISTDLNPRYPASGASTPSSRPARRCRSTCGRNTKCPPSPVPNRSRSLDPFGYQIQTDSPSDTMGAVLMLISLSNPAPQQRVVDEGRNRSTTDIAIDDLAPKSSWKKRRISRASTFAGADRLLRFGLAEPPAADNRKVLSCNSVTLRAQRQ